MCVCVWMSMYLYMCIYMYECMCAYVYMYILCVCIWIFQGKVICYECVQEILLLTFRGTQCLNCALLEATIATSEASPNAKFPKKNNLIASDGI